MSFFADKPRLVVLFCLFPARHYPPGDGLDHRPRTSDSGSVPVTKSRGRTDWGGQIGVLSADRCERFFCARGASLVVGFCWVLQRLSERRAGVRTPRGGLSQPPEPRVLIRRGKKGKSSQTRPTLELWSLRRVKVWWSDF